jgi:hypothetical protein
MHAKKLMNQKNYIMENKKITELEIEEIKKELQGTQKSHLNETEEEQSERLCTINEDKKKQNSEPAAAVEMETHQQRRVICK